MQKIERLKSELHLLDAEGKQKNTHTFFVDTKKKGRSETFYYNCSLLDHFMFLIKTGLTLTKSTSLSV